MRIFVILALAALAGSIDGAGARPATSVPPIVFSSGRLDRDLIVMHRDGTRRRLLTAGGRDDSSPAWSPDKSRIAFSFYNGRRERVAVIDLRNGRVKDLGDGFNPDWSPDGRRLVFLDAEGFDDLVTMSANGSNRRKLNLKGVGIADETDPSWSPDGSKIAFVGNGLYVVDPKGRNARRIRPEGGPGGATWAPDGRRLAFDCVKRGFEVCVVGAGGRRLRGLTSRGAHPSWSPRGDLIAVAREFPPATVLVRPNGRFVRLVRGTSEGKIGWSPDGGRLVVDHEVGANAIRLYSTAATRGRLARLTQDPLAHDAAPAWSPDGRQVAFRRLAAGRCSLRVVSVGTRHVRTLVRRTTGRPCIDRPDWSHDQKQIVYASGDDLWVVASRGGSPRRLTKTPGREASPRWAPDRRSIGFLAAGGIWLLDPEGQRTLLVPGAGPFAWSHDGTMLAYLVYDENRQESDLFLREGDAPPRRLVEAVGDAPAWSPDDRRIATATSGSSNGGEPALVVTDLAGHATEILDEASQPDWRP